jgi:hypothetical protein
MTKETGGAAFPVDEEALMRNMTGMTLRDYFAAKAMREVKWQTGKEDISAKNCYEVADAMLEARK